MTRKIFVLIGLMAAMTFVLAKGCGGGGGGAQETNCTDNVDNDGDNYTDCQDSDCAHAPACQSGNEQRYHRDSLRHHMTLPHIPYTMLRDFWSSRRATRAAHVPAFPKSVPDLRRQASVTRAKRRFPTCTTYSPGPRASSRSATRWPSTRTAPCLIIRKASELLAVSCA